MMSWTRQRKSAAVQRIETAHISNQTVQNKYMGQASETFQAKSAIKAADLEHRRKIRFNIGKYDAVVPIGKQQFLDVVSLGQSEP